MKENKKQNFRTAAITQLQNLLLLIKGSHRNFQLYVTFVTIVECSNLNWCFHHELC